MNKISVVINTYNAEEHLEKVLEAVKDFDEIVVCDMESTDSTVSIAERHGCRVVTFEKKDYNIVEPARDFAIHSATHEWVFVVDADEIVRSELKDFLYEEIKKADCTDGYFIPRKNYFMGRFMKSLYPDYILRFFRKDKTVWSPVIHVQPNVNGSVGYAPKESCKIAFEHLAKDNISMRLQKTDVYTDNEVRKKANKRYGLFALLWRPFFRAFKLFVLKGAWRDGKAGLVRACLDGFYQFVIVAKIIEKNNSPHQQK